MLDIARQYTKRKKSGVRLYGFEEYIEALQQLTDSGVDTAAERCFEICCNIVNEEFEKKMQQKNVPDSLQSKKRKFKFHRNNIYMYSEGWDKNDEETFNKVCYLNYGTPTRTTKSGANRGRIEAKGFIANTKRAAAQRMRKVQKDALKQITQELKK